LISVGAVEPDGSGGRTASGKITVRSVAMRSNTGDLKRRVEQQ
jgi:hypothetical protein